MFRSCLYLTRCKGILYPLSLSRQTSRGTFDYIREESDWTIKAIDLLRKLRQRFSATFEAWDRFNSPDGGRKFFVHVPGPFSDSSLNGIKDTFQDLLDLERRLRFLDQSCEKHYKIVRWPFVPPSYITLIHHKARATYQL